MKGRVGIKHIDFVILILSSTGNN